MNITSSLDLNLLTVFDALYGARSATEAAARLGLSQPAISHALKRLRLQLGDPLFRRTRRGMVPTRRAVAMAADIRAALRHLNAALEPPHRSRRGDQLAGSVVIRLEPYLRAFLLPLLIARSERQAPRIKLEVCDAEPASGIGGPQDRRIDLFVDRHFNGGRLDLRSKRLLSDRQVCITRRDLAGPSRVMTRELFSVLNHVTGLADDPVRQRLDRELAGAGLSWHVGTQLPDMLVAPWLVAASDSTAILPARQAVWFAGILPIDVLEPPVPLSEVVHYLIWRQGLEETDAAAWVRGQLMEIVRDSMPAT